MKILVFGTTESLQRSVTREATTRGHDVVTVEAEASDAAAARLARGVDVIVSTLPPAEIISTAQRAGVKRVLVAQETDVAAEDIQPDTNDIAWTVISPATPLCPGSRTAKYRIAYDASSVHPGDDARLSFDDYAVAVVDELERQQHVRQHFLVA